MPPGFIFAPRSLTYSQDYVQTDYIMVIGMNGFGCTT